MNYNKICEHKNLKYFEETQKVICLDCGKSFEEHNPYPIYPHIPYTTPTTNPNYPNCPIYPTVTWNKIE